jgi:hypothetical protein
MRISRHPASYYRRAMQIATRVSKLAVCQFLVSRFPQKVDPFVDQQEEEQDDEEQGAKEEVDDDDPFWSGLPRPSS